MPKPVTPSPAIPSTNSQWNAIQNNANSNSLVNQLYAGKPAAQFAPTVAASSQVKNQNAPVSSTPPVAQQPTFSQGTNGAGQGMGSIIPSSNPAPQTPTAPAITGNTTTPSGAVVNATTGQTVSAPTNTFPGIIGGLTSAAEGNPAIANTVQQEVAPYTQESLTDLQEAKGLQQGATQLETTGGPSGPLLGNALADQQLAAQEQNLGVSAGQLANAATGEGLTAQNQEQTGLQQAGALTQPSGTFPFVFDPTTGSYSVSGGNLQTAISGGVQQAVSNPALYTSLNNAITSTYGNAAAGMFQQAYINAGGNPNTAAGAAAGAQAVAAAPGQAQAQNIGTTETAATSAANTAYGAAVQNVSKVTGMYTGATGVASNLTTTLGSWLQSGQITNVNAALNKIAGLTSSPEYAQFNTAMTNAQTAYTAAFTSAGITPTQSTINAINELNPNSSASTIVASLNQLSSDLHAATVVPAYQQQTTYASQLGIQ